MDSETYQAIKLIMHSVEVNVEYSKKSPVDKAIKKLKKWIEGKEERLEYLRGEIRAEKISYGEIAELQSLKEYINPDDVELLQWAGVEEGRKLDND